MSEEKYHLEKSESALIQMVRDYELKIFTSLVHSRNQMMLIDYCKPGPQPVIPTQWDSLIIYAQKLNKEFDTLNESQLANENRQLFIGEVNFTLTRLEDSVTNELTDRLLQHGKPKELIKHIYQGYTNYLKVVLQHVKDLISKESELRKKLPVNNKKGGKSKPTYLQLALYYYYMQEAVLIDRFENWSGGIVAAYKEVCRLHQLTAETSWRRFQREYTGIKNESNRKKLGSRHFTILVGLLEGEPAAIQIANKELKPTQRQTHL